MSCVSFGPPSTMKQIKNPVINPPTWPAILMLLPIKVKATCIAVRVHICCLSLSVIKSRLFIEMYSKAPKRPNIPPLAPIVRLSDVKTTRTPLPMTAKRNINA